jgi:hypothetical protein
MIHALPFILLVMLPCNVNHMLGHTSFGAQLCKQRRSCEEWRPLLQKHDLLPHFEGSRAFGKQERSLKPLLITLNVLRRSQVKITPTDI